MEKHQRLPRSTTRSIGEIARDFDALTADDFDHANADARGLERLDKLCDEIQAINIPVLCAPVLLRTMERLNGAEIGNPGSLVHTLEKWIGSYETLLAESVRRAPTPLTVWMVNRILNAKPHDSESWLDLLHGVATNPAASVDTCAKAQRFIEWQLSQSQAKPDASADCGNGN